MNGSNYFKLRSIYQLWNTQKNTDILDFDDVNNTPFVSKRYGKTETKEEREITFWIDTIGRRAMISIFKT